MNGAPVTFADEPTGALDSKTAREVMALLLTMIPQQGKTLLVVTHDPNVAAACSRVVYLQDGQIVSDQRNNQGGVPASQNHAHESLRSLAVSGRCIMQIYALLAKRTLWSSQAILPVLAFAASSALFLTVAGGVQALSTWLEHANVDHEMINLMGIQKLYMGLAWVAALVLIVPLFTLGASAARLSARRRDERLASLRLIGASTTLIVGLSVADALVYSLVGFTYRSVALPGADFPVRRPTLHERSAGC